MKKNLCVSGLVLTVLFMFASMVYSQVVIVTPDQKTVYWNPANGATSYEVFTLSHGGDKNDENARTLVGETDQLQQSITFSVEGKYIIGVRSVKDVEGTLLYSDINWSDINGASTPNPFEVVYATIPDWPEGLRDIP